MFYSKSIYVCVLAVHEVLWSNRGYAVVDGVTYRVSGKMIGFVNDLSF